MISQKQRDLTTYPQKTIEIQRIEIIGTIFESKDGNGPTMVAAAFQTAGDYLEHATDDGAELQFSYNGRLYKAWMEPEPVF